MMRRNRSERATLHLDLLADKLLQALRDSLIGRIDVDGVGARYFVHIVRTT